jgi:hypothetical protein
MCPKPGIVPSHPGRKDKGAARVGHPIVLLFALGLVLPVKTLYSSIIKVPPFPEVKKQHDRDSDLAPL